MPDSNVNAATTDDTVQLFGFLPADLSDDARRTSGVGLRSGVALNWLPKLSPKWRGDVRSSINFTDYERALFDDLIIGGDIGLRRLNDKGYVSVVANYARRWFGNASFYSSYGGRIFATRRVTPRLNLSGYISAAYFDYDVNEAREGPVVSASLNVFRAFTSSQYGGARMTVTREFARDADFRSTDYALQLSYIRDFPRGLTLEATPFAAYRPFDAESVLFSETRTDWRYGASVSVTKRDWSVFGWAPVISYGYTRNISTINVFDFTRHQGELRFTRVF